MAYLISCPRGEILPARPPDPLGAAARPEMNAGGDGIKMRRPWTWPWLPRMVRLVHCACWWGSGVGKLGENPRLAPCGWKTSPPFQKPVQIVYWLEPDPPTEPGPPPRGRWWDAGSNFYFSQRLTAKGGVVPPWFELMFMWKDFLGPFWALLCR